MIYKLSDQRNYWNLVAYWGRNGLDLFSWTVIRKYSFDNLFCRLFLQFLLEF